MTIQVIHTVWLGPHMPTLAKVCIDDWKKQGYQVKVWTDSDPIVQKWINECRFAKECLKRSLYAFVSDYIRLKVLQHSGGLYLDTDVTIQKEPFSLFEGLKFSVGYETEDAVGTALIYSEPDSMILKELIDFYESKIWASSLYIGPSIQTHILFDKGCKELEPCKIYPRSYFFDFHPDENLLDYKRGESIYITHWFNNSWGKSKGVGFLKGKHKGLVGRFYELQKQWLR